MNRRFKLLDVVALLEDVPLKKLRKGQVGTIVEIFDDDAFEVEFCNKKGETLALIPLHADDLLLLRYEMEYA